MSGGPQVFLGATTFCVTCRQISGCREEHLLVPVCLVCPWAAARPLAVRAASFARRVVSKPGQALPPPTGTAAGPSGALHTGGAWLLMCYWVRCFEARPGPAPRRVPYPQFRMQFPDTCSSSLSEKPGISMITFQSMKCAWGNCMRVFWAVGTLLPAGGAAGTREPSGPFV